MKSAVITGALSGLAQAVIKNLLEDGYTVFEGDIAIKEEEIRGNEYLFPLDLTNDDSILKFYKRVTSYIDKVDVITNFAGIVIVSSLINTLLSSSEDDSCSNQNKLSIVSFRNNCSPFG